MAAPRRGAAAPPGFRDLVEGDLKQRRYRPVYVLVGYDAYRIENIVQHLRDQAIGTAQAAFNYHVRHGVLGGLESALQLAHAIPMLGGLQLIWLRDADRALGTREAEEALLGYLGRPVPETILVLSAESVDGRKRWVKAVREGGWPFQMDPPAGRELLAWITEAARRRRVPLDEETAALLVELVGEDLHALTGELEKLGLLLEKIATPSREAIRELIVQQRLGDAFELADAIRPGNAAEALAVWQRQAAWGRDPHEVSALLASRFRKMALVSALAAGGADRRDLSTRLGMNPWYCDRLLASARALGAAGLQRALAACHRCDLDLKRSPLKPESVLERAILEICQNPA